MCIVQAYTFMMSFWNSFIVFKIVQNCVFLKHPIIYFQRVNRFHQFTVFALTKYILYKIYVHVMMNIICGSLQQIEQNG